MSKRLEGTDVQNGSVAVGASRREQVVIVRLAVWPAVALEEIPCAELLVTMCAGEVFRMPCLAQRGDDLHITLSCCHCFEDTSIALSKD